MAPTVKLKPATFKHIEAELYAYHETRKEIQRIREEIINGSALDENIGGSRGNEPGRPTERIATRLVTDRRLRNLEEVVEAIDSVYNSLPENHQKMVRLKYWSSRHLSWGRIAEECHVHPNTMTRMRRDVIYMIAEKLGWR